MRYLRLSDEIAKRNIGGGSRVTVNQVIREFESILGRRVQLRYGNVQPGRVSHTSAGINRAVAAIGYVPHTKLRDGGLQTESDSLRQENLLHDL